MRFLQIILMVVTATFAAAHPLQPSSSSVLRLPGLQPSRINHTRLAPPRNPWPELPLEIDLDSYRSVTYLKVNPQDIDDPRTIGAVNAWERLFFWLNEDKPEKPMIEGRFQFEGLDVTVKPVQGRFRVTKGTFEDVILTTQAIWYIYGPAEFIAQIAFHGKVVAKIQLRWVPATSAS